jgi:hypothetical protein
MKSPVGPSAPNTIRTSPFGSAHGPASFAVHALRYRCNITSIQQKPITASPLFAALYARAITYQSIGCCVLHEKSP